MDNKGDMNNNSNTLIYPNNSELRQTGQIYTKMSQVMADIGSIGKNQKNSAQGFKFRGIDDMLNSLYPVLCKHGVFMTTDVVSQSAELKDVERSSGKKGVDKHVALTMRYTFHAADGSSVSSTVAAEGLDSGDKATNKALSAALKYALIQTFSIPTVDMTDGDFETPEMGTTTSISKGNPPGITQNIATVTPNGGEVHSAPVVSSFRKPTTTELPKGWK